MEVYFMKKRKKIEYKNCPYCNCLMDYGVRWSRSRSRIKKFYFCPNCRSIYYKSDFKLYEDK